MIPVEVVRYQQRLDDLFEKITILPDEPEIQSHWAKYLCVLVSGYLEVSTRELLLQYAKSRSSPLITNFVDSQLKQFQNPKMEKVLDLLSMFSPEWEEEFRSVTQGEIKDAVDSIVENRHKIAHGESVGLTFTRIRKYYQSANKFVDLLEARCI